MPIRLVSGDLFDNSFGARAFAHGCNCQGSMRAGIARTFRERYPEMYEEYRRQCKAEPCQFNLGNCWLCKADDRPWVFNLGTQEGYWRSRASYEAIETALRRMREQADGEGITGIAMPRIGVGYGGLSWKKVRAIVEAVFADWPGTLVVYEEFVPGGPGLTAQGREEVNIPRTSTTGSMSESPAARSSIDRSSVASARADDRKGQGTMNVLNFYSVSGEFGCFSNFSPHPIVLAGRTWPTSEHYFQAQKFAGTPGEEEVRLAKSPQIAARMGRSRSRPLRKDWESVKNLIMHEVVLAKFTQYDDLREILLGIGDSKIVEHTEHDHYWGDGGDGGGTNMLGVIQMRVREELQAVGRQR